MYIPSASISGYRPLYDASGLVNSYGNYSTPLYKAPVVQPPVYDPLTGNYSKQTPGVPQWDAASGRFLVGGQPFTGNYNGDTYTNGLSSRQVADSPSRYQRLDIAKNPGVASAADNLLASFKSTPGISDFGSLLDASRLGKSLTDLNATQAANNTTLNKRYSSILGNLATGENAIVDQANASVPGQFDPLFKANQTFADAGTGLNKDYSALLDSLSSKEGDIIGRANALLPQYDTAANRIGDAATNALFQNNSRYAVGSRASGGANGMSSDEQQRLLHGVQAIRLPLEQQKIQRRYDLLTGLELPTAQADTSRRVGQIADFSMPLQRAIYNNDYNTNAAENARYNEILQNLQLPLLEGQGQRAIGQLTGFTAPRQDQQYQAEFNTPAAITALLQSILGGNQNLRANDLSYLSGLNNLYSGSRYQSLRDVLGTNVTAPQNYTFRA